MATITLPDGTQHTYATRVRLSQLAAELAEDPSSIVAGVVDQRVRDLETYLPREGGFSVSFLPRTHPDAEPLLVRSAAILARRALCRASADIQLGDVRHDSRRATLSLLPRHSVSLDSLLGAAAAELPLLLSRDEPFERLELPRDEAIRIFEDTGQPLIAARLAAGEPTVTVYRQGEFLDAWEGPMAYLPSQVGRLVLRPAPLAASPPDRLLVHCDVGP